MKTTTRYLLIAAIIAGIVAFLVFRANSRSELTPQPTAAATSQIIPSGTPEPVAPAALGPLAVPSGKIAVSVELSDAAHVGSFLRPGSFITIFDTVASLTLGTTGLPVRETRVLLTKAEVIGIAGYTSAEEVDAVINDSTKFLVTVAVTQKEAERLIHGIQSGALYFGLLSSDTKIVPGPGVTDETIFAGVN
jgi:pilus assembly protein CpaB